MIDVLIKKIVAKIAVKQWVGQRIKFKILPLSDSLGRKFIFNFFNKESFKARLLICWFCEFLKIVGKFLISALLLIYCTSDYLLEPNESKYFYEIDFDLVWHILKMYVDEKWEKELPASVYH